MTLTPFQLIYSKLYLAITFLKYKPLIVKPLRTPLNKKTALGNNIFKN